MAEWHRPAEERKRSVSVGRGRVKAHLRLRASHALWVPAHSRWASASGSEGLAALAGGFFAVSHFAALGRAQPHLPLFVKTGPRLLGAVKPRFGLPFRALLGPCRLLGLV